jgi:hypothetical protein
MFWEEAGGKLFLTVLAGSLNYFIKFVDFEIT